MIKVDLELVSLLERSQHALQHLLMLLLRVEPVRLAVALSQVVVVGAALAAQLRQSAKFSADWHEG